MANGYALHLTAASNLTLLDCHRHNAEKAYKSRLGILHQERFSSPLASNDLTPSERGYRAIYGKITHFAQSQLSFWINLGEKLALRIVREDLENFNEIDFNTLARKYVQTQGMLYSRNNQLRIRIRHPIDFDIHSNEILGPNKF